MNRRPLSNTALRKLHRERCRLQFQFCAATPGAVVRAPVQYVPGGGVARQQILNFSGPGDPAAVSPPGSQGTKVAGRFVVIVEDGDWPHVITEARA